MEEIDNPKIEFRKRRVKRLKRMILFTLATIILVPYMLCVVLFFKMHKIETDLSRATAQISELASLLNERLVYGTAASAQSQNTVVTKSDTLSADSDSDQPITESETAAPEIEESGTTVPISEASRKVYLTFDDGPSMYTEAILDILDRYGVKATFFVTGKEDEKSQERLKEIVDRGNSLGMHSYSHIYNEVYQSLDSFAADFHKIQDYLYQVTGVESKFYRFPGGSSNTVSSVDMEVFADYLHEQGVEFYDWNLSSQDASVQLKSVGEIVQNATSELGEYSTAIILMHDSAAKRTTVEALPIIIENILAMEDTVILPITEDTVPIQHIHFYDTDRMED